MSSSNRNTLAFAFPTGDFGKGKKAAAVAPSTGTIAATIDVRKFSKPNRMMLVKGATKLAIVNLDDKKPLDIPRPLFIAASTTPEIIQNEKIDLSHCVDSKGVRAFVAYMIEMTAHPLKDWHMPIYNLSLFQMLSITAAAKMLGMDKYANHVYRACEARIRNQQPSTNELNAITLFARQHDRLLNITAKTLAHRIRNNTLSKPEVIRAYLENNTTLKARVDAAEKSHNGWVRFEKQKAEHRLIQQELHEQQAKFQQEAREKKAKRDAEDRAFWEKKNAQDRANEQACLDFMRTPVGQRKKLSAAQKAHWTRTRGTQPPQGA